MCWNKTVSCITLGVGFAANLIGIAVIDDQWFTYFSFLFFYLLLMQLAELIAYVAKDKSSQLAMNYATQLAFLANISQPLVSGMLLISAQRFLPKQNDATNLIALGVMALYAGWLCWTSTRLPNYRYISKNLDINKDRRSEPCYARDLSSVGKIIEWNISKTMEYWFGDREEDCHSHLVYPWWEDMSPVPFLICLATVIILLVKPVGFAIYVFVSIFGVLLLSILLFNDGQTGSQWCFGVVFLCLINPVAYWLLK